MTWIRLLIFAVFGLATAGWSQVAVLDNFNNPGASGAVLTGTSWVGQTTRTATTLSVGGTAKDDNGWEANGLNIDASSMTHLTIVAQRDAGHVAANLVIELQDAELDSVQIVVPASSFAIGTLTTVTVPLGTWPANFNPARITRFTIGGGTTGLVAFRMTFDNISLTGGAAPVPPAITQHPADQVVGIDTGTTFTVAATSSSGPLRYQWKKAGSPIAGATQATLALASLTVDQSGLYQADVSNDAGTTSSREARLTVLDARPTHALAPGAPGYVSGGTVSITNTLTYAGPATQVRWSVMLPTGWTLASDTATTAAMRPPAGTATLAEWTWNTVPTSPLTFTFALNVPIGTEGDRSLTALVTLTQNGATGDIIVKRDALVIPNVNSRHAADTDGDFRISLMELTRVIELYNTRNGTVRTGAYDLSTTASEDGFAPAPTRANTATTLARYHSADTNRDGRLNLTELTRVIELYNFRAGTVRTGQYHVDPSNLEDGFGVGP